jgi:ABC-type uncharacterized transport system substrate-binding protein
VAAYHDGFRGQELKVQGARSVLEGKCEIRQFNMDTKRNPSPDFCRHKALEAKALIESWKPDIVIASDDNASKYLVAPYFKDAKLPFVFCGINWTAKEYGYPYSNATGMIEITPLKPMIRYVRQILPEAKTAVCLRPDRISEKKTCNRHTQVFSPLGIEVITKTADNMDDFEKHYITAQDSDFILMSNNSTINDWDGVRAKKIVLKHSRRLTITMNSWLVSYAMLGLTTVAEEQGEYAAEVALKILDGAKPIDIPVISNRKWNIYVNKELLKKAGIILPADILQQAYKVD